jgi:hypothetical protein
MLASIEVMDMSTIFLVFWAKPHLKNWLLERMLLFKVLNHIRRLLLQHKTPMPFRCFSLEGQPSFQDKFPSA